VAWNGKMPDLLHEGGLTVANAGIFKDAAKSERVADFSYQNDSLAQMIVYAWTDPAFRTWLLQPQNAKDALAQRGIYLNHPVVITEDQFHHGFPVPDPTAVVFVLPDQPRIGVPPLGQSLLETARLLMACTPNGI
jgi:hypothetical protein